MPGRPNLALSLKVPAADYPVPELPFSFPPKVPSVKMPGRPNLGLKLGVPSPNLPSYDFPPPMPKLSCPLDVKA